MRKRHDIQAKLTAIGELSRDQLSERWRKIYGHSPPKGVRRELLVRAVSWHLQAKRLGGYSAETRRLLKSAMEAAGKQLGSNASVNQRVYTALHNDVVHGRTDGGLTSVSVKSAATTRKRPRPGARLVRDWKGKTHVVDVIETGFVFEAKVYASLSSIARKITGARWSGPRFFGL